MAIEKISEKVPTGESKSAPEKEKINRPEIKDKAERSWFRPERSQKQEKSDTKSEDAAVTAAPAPAPAWQTARAAAIDTILSEGLNEIFLQMKPAEQRAFKQKGEETVAKINEILSKTKFKIAKIIGLIRDWLKMVPGINKFFLEQEAKIKADKIVKLKDKF